MLSIFFRFFALLFLFVALGAVLFGSYQMLMETEAGFLPMLRPAAANRLLISMDSFKVVQTEQGKVAWSLRSKNAELYENREARLKDVELIFNNPDGRTAALVGENATFDTASGDAAIRRGNREVRIITSDGYLMTTDSLFWKAADRIVRTSDPFKVLGKEIYLEGRGMSANADLEKVVVNNDVKAVLQE